MEISEYDMHANISKLAAHDVSLADQPQVLHAPCHRA